MPYQIEAVENLTAAIQSGSLPAARAAYSRARYPYEQMEVRGAPASAFALCTKHHITAWQGLTFLAAAFKRFII
jgi:Imelysin